MNETPLAKGEVFLSYSGSGFGPGGQAIENFLDFLGRGRRASLLGEKRGEISGAS